MRSTRNSISLSCCSIFRLHNQASSLPGCPTSGNSINLLRQHPRNPQPCGLDSAHSIGRRYRPIPSYGEFSAEEAGGYASGEISGLAGALLQRKRTMPARVLTLCSISACNTRSVACDLSSPTGISNIHRKCDEMVLANDWYPRMFERRTALFMRLLTLAGENLNMGTRTCRPCLFLRSKRGE